jgi:hypothetical protein
MILLWSFLVAAGLLIVCAGAQAVSLLREREAQIVQIQGQVTVMNDDTQRMRKQLEAEKILLRQAQQWIAAKQTAVNAAATPPSVQPATQK